MMNSDRQYFDEFSFDLMHNSKAHFPKYSISSVAFDENQVIQFCVFALLPFLVSSKKVDNTK